MIFNSLTSVYLKVFYLQAFFPKFSACIDILYYCLFDSTLKYNSFKYVLKNPLHVTMIHSMAFPLKPTV